MKFFTTIFLSTLSFLCVSQKIDYSNFNNISLNNELIKEFNQFRTKSNLDTLVYSSELYKAISKVNCIEVSNSEQFYHPDLKQYWVGTDLKSKITIECIKNKIGGNFKIKTDNTYWMDVYENAFRTTRHFETYKDLAKFAIYTWSVSKKGHSEVQSMTFSTMGLPGIFSCHSELSKNGFVYVFINFVKIHRV